MSTITLEQQVAARATAEATTWAKFDPCALLERLIKIDNNGRGAK